MSDVASFAREKRQTQTTLKTHQVKPLTNLSQTTWKRCGYGESEWEHLNSRLHGSSANELLKTEFLITKTVTKMSPMDMLSNKNVTHGHAVDRARARFEKGTSSGNVTTILTKKKGRPSSCDSTLNVCSTTSQRHTREQCYQKHKCVFCQDDTGSKLHDVSSKNMGTQIKTIGQETSNEGLRVRFSNVACSSDPLQSVSDDMKYHLPCLVNAKRDIDQSKQPQSATVNCGQLLSDRQLLDS